MSSSTFLWDEPPVGSMKNGDLIGQNDGIMGIEWDTMVDNIWDIQVWEIYQNLSTMSIKEKCHDISTSRNADDTNHNGNIYI